ncbi:MAG TPA: hypothetical protein VFY13_10545, partial [Luteolibacter sp.]|nr:hypothetical protein [Luteolibacter sp.]
MQNYCKTIGALAAASALVAGTASAEVNYLLHAGWSSEYQFRGTDLGDNLIESGIDLATEYNGFGLSAGVWTADFDTTTGGSLTETDLYGEVTKDLGFATLGVGAIWYMNEDTATTTYDDAEEVSFSLSRELGYGVKAKLAYFWDINTDNEGYSELSLEKTFELTKCLNVGVKTALGYNVEEGQIANWVTTAKLNYAISDTATFSPFVTA